MKGNASNKFKKDFATRLCRAMREKGVTQGQLADAIGVYRQCISMYVTEKTLPDGEKITKIADFLDVSTDYLLNRTDTRNPHQSISEYTGLTENAIEALKQLDEKALSGLNSFLEGLLKR